jgi:hypothetical protein
MRIPPKIPALKWLTIVLGIYFALWLSWEGRLWQVVGLGVGVSAVSLIHLLQNKLGGQIVTLSKWLTVTAVLGLLFGLGSGVLTLVFMAVKTGLHAHGPEFTIQQIRWVIQQIPLWTIAGLLAGLGLGLLTAKQK